MNRSSSNWTGRIPRSCQEAFGPYTDYLIEETDKPRAGAAAWLVWAIIVMTVLLLIVGAGRTGN